MADTKPNPPSQKKSAQSKKAAHHRLFAAVLIILMIWWFNNYTLKVNDSKLRSAKIRTKFRIAVLSDLHASNFAVSNNTIAKKIKDSKPDIVFVLGDMYTMDSSEELMQKPIDLTKDILSSGIPVYFVTGEHDTKKYYTEGMQNAGAILLNYDDAYININGNPVRIIGIDNVYYSETFDLRNEFGLSDDCFNILLAHIPNYEKFALFGADLTICADTHGGMIQLPFDKGPVYSEGNWFPQFKSTNKVYDKGYFDYTGGTMFVTSGIGNYPVPARFNNRPEIAVIDIIPE